MKKKYIQISWKMMLIFSLISCKKFVEIEVPKTDLVSSTVFAEDGTAIAAISAVYGQLANNNVSFASGPQTNISFLSALSADELNAYNTSLASFESNNLTATTTQIGSAWSECYATIYRVNAIIGGLQKSETLTPSLKMQLEGEAKFIRSFTYFYLINLFGDVPLNLTTDYKINSIMPRTPVAEIYKQIIQDLKEAQVLLSNDYSFSLNERVRVNRWAATALLARIYLYTKSWSEAEVESTKVIDNTALYRLTTLLDVFKKNSTEAIWQLTRDTRNTNDYSSFTFSTTPTSVALSSQYYSSFSSIDQRRNNWIITKVAPLKTYYQPSKYKAVTNIAVTTPPTLPTEYSMVLRLAEQYLIRSEARVNLGKLTGSNSALSDLNVIHMRAGLSEISLISKDEIQLAIENERKWEFFTEWGHRWLDLKRLNKADEILQSIKSANWQPTDKLYPIPAEQILRNPSMTNAQNPGYN